MQFKKTIAYYYNTILFVLNIEWWCFKCWQNSYSKIYTIYTKFIQKFIQKKKGILLYNFFYRMNKFN